LFADDTNTFGEGAIAGACAFHWVEWQDSPHGWTMTWIWLAPRVRRCGILRRAWPEFTRRFDKFYLLQPLSDSMKEFAQTIGHFNKAGRSY
jgi:hypothetical protein